MTQTHLVDETIGLLEKLRGQKPLVHNITNYVVMNFSANALLSIGASPVMAHANEEVEEMASIAGALVINIGTLSPAWISAMHTAGKTAAKRKIPIILDPVGAGATKLRTDTVHELLESFAPTVIRGNASEILAVAAQEQATKGVDSTHDVSDAEAAGIALAKKYDCVVAVTGPEDFVTDGSRVARVRNGHALMGRITGSGCVATTLIGAFSAVGDDPLVAAAAALGTYGVAGELAASDNPRPGSYRALLIDGLDEVNRTHLTEKLVIHVEDAATA